MAARKSTRVHRKYKTKYRVTNWQEYERALRSRGDITVWFSDEKRTRDGGRDIVAIGEKARSLLKYIIECKRHRKDRKVGISYVRALYGVKLSEGATKAILATTSGFTKGAFFAVFYTV